MKIKALLSETYVHPEFVEHYEERWHERNTRDTQDLEEEPEGEPKYKTWNYNVKLFTLADLLKLSKGVDPKNVSVHIYRDREMQDLTVAVLQSLVSGKQDVS